MRAFKHSPEPSIRSVYTHRRRSRPHDAAGLGLSRWMLAVTVEAQERADAQLRLFDLPRVPVVRRR